LEAPGPVVPDAMVPTQYNGHLLYQFANDMAQGDSKAKASQAFGGTWPAATPGLTPMRTLVRLRVSGLLWRGAAQHSTRYEKSAPRRAEYRQPYSNAGDRSQPTMSVIVRSESTHETV